MNLSPTSVHRLSPPIMRICTGKIFYISYIESFEYFLEQFPRAIRIKYIHFFLHRSFCIVINIDTRRIFKVNSIRERKSYFYPKKNIQLYRSIIILHPLDRISNQTDPRNQTFHSIHLCNRMASTICGVEKSLRASRNAV